MTAEVEVHLRRRFQCSTCGRSSSKRKVILDHVAEGCIKDPDARACPTCVHNGQAEMGGFYCSLGLLEPPAAVPGDPLGAPVRESFLRNCSSWAPLP